MKSFSSFRRTTLLCRARRRLRAKRATRSLYLAPDWSSPNQSVAPGTLSEYPNEYHRPISSSYFSTFIYIYTGMIEGQKAPRTDNPGCLGHFICHKASLKTHHGPASARSDPGSVPSFGTLAPSSQYLSLESLLPLWTFMRCKTFSAS